MFKTEKKIELLSFSFVILISLYLLYISINVFYTNTSSPSDENQFIDSPSKYVVNKKLKVLVDNTNDRLNVFDTIYPGQFLVSISDIDLISSVESPVEIVESIPEESLIPIKIYDIHTDRTGKYYINKQDALDEFYTYLCSSALVTSVVENGASDRAGIRVGDIIVEINGANFENVRDADKIMRSAQSDKLVKYKIYRNNQLYDLNVLLAKFGVKFSILNIFIIGILIWLFGFLLIAFRFNQFGARYLGISFVLIGFNFATPGVLLVSNYFDSYYRFLPLLSFGFGIACYFHSLTYFPYLKDKLALKKKNIAIYYLSSIIIMAVYTYIALSEAKLNFYIDYHIVILIALFIIYKINYFLIEKKQDNFQRKSVFPLKIMGYTFLSSLIIIIILNTLFIDKFKWINNGLLNDSFNSLIILFPITHLYVIFKNNLYDLSFQIRRNIKYIIINNIIRIFALVLFLVSVWFIAQLHINVPNIRITGNSIEMLNTPMSHDNHEFYLNLITGSILILYFIIYSKMYRKFKVFLDRKFYRINYDYRRAATEFSNILAKHINIIDLIQSIAKELSDILNIKRLGLIVFKSDSKIHTMEFTGFQSTEFKEFCNASSSSIFTSLSQINKEVNTSLLPDPLDKVFKSFRFHYLIPIKSKTKVFGVILLSEKMSESAFDNEDFDFVSSIASQLSVAIENGILYENLAEQERIKHELEIARRIQIASLPQSDPKINGLDIVGMSLPALEVGGDFYDYLYNNDDEITIVIGDVSGKGTSAALYMSKTQGIIRTLYEFEQSPKNLMIRTNQLIYKYLEKNYFISAMTMNIDTKDKSIVLARAGHLPLYYYNSSSKAVEKITPKGMMLGLKKERLFERNLEELSLNYEIGDVFVLVTDGVTEARNRMLQEFGDDNLIATIEKNSNKSAVDIKNSILFSLQKFIGDELQNDDLTLIVIKAE